VSKLICASAIDGAVRWVARAEAALSDAIEAKGESTAVGFGNTAYFLPIIYSLTEERVETLGDCRRILKRARALLPERPSEQTWLPYLGNTLDAGAAALFACEIIEACKYLVGPDPVEDIWLGAASDIVLRERGIEFVDGTAPGFAAITGAAPSSEIAVRIARELQEKSLYVFMAGSCNGRQFAEQLAEQGVQLGWETRLVPFGRDVSALVYALGFANRVALSFGGIQPGDYAANLEYNKDRVFAFVLAFGEVDAEKYAAAAGALNYGFPVIADTDIPQILPTGICTYEHVVSEVPHETMVEKALEVRGCKVRVSEVPVPVSFGPAFEGEHIRKADVRVEFGGNKTSAFEFLTSVELDDIDDGEIEIIGPDIDAVEEGTALPLGIWVEVAGRKMQSDFEPILERQIHHFLNGAAGIWHMGQRDIVWTRVSKEGFQKGLRLEHYGRILHAKLLGEYPALVDKVKVTLITEAEEVERRIDVARAVYDERNRRLETLTDESVDTFYSCLLCQSFAPNHVCIISPERLGLCGAYNWLDGRAAYEIDETGPNQPVAKGECLDAVKGVFQNVNDYVHTQSHGEIEEICTYSIMDRPMTSCGCFEVICGYVPECNGVMVVNREYEGDTPVGMSFSSLAGSVGGGQQTPGFMGCGKVFLTSQKFLLAEGGQRRLVWMPKELKELLGEDLRVCLERQGAAEVVDKIADETVAIDPQEIRTHMERCGHPALEMDDMGVHAQGEAARAETTDQEEPPPAGASTADAEEPEATGSALPADALEQLKATMVEELKQEIRASLKREIVGEIIGTLSEKFLGAANPAATGAPAATVDSESAAAVESSPPPAPPSPSARARLSEVETVPIDRDRCEMPIWTVTLGATPEQGGTRGKTWRIGGATAMPFHLWEGEMPNRPLVAMEVFDLVSEKYPAVLREIYAGVLDDPARMARSCVEESGADLISVRLEGTHPEKAGRSPEQAVEVVQSVLEAVDVPLIVTGHSHFDTVNQVMKAVAKACEGENLLLNWVERDNYRTVAGAALAYGHSIVAQSPIDVNIAKQLNILLTDIGAKREQIVIDPMAGAMGYGLEYSYSVMERIRISGLRGDEMLAGPMIVAPGAECARIKEWKAPESDFPAWGDLSRRAAAWELAGAISLLYAGADLLILYHPEAVAATKKAIDRLMDAVG
jgi:acetyl-CoA synthase